MSQDIFDKLRAIKHPFPLRPYQIEAIGNFSKSIRGGFMKMEVSTGGGKTLIFEKCTEQFPNERFALIVPFVNLAHQTLEGRNGWGIRQGSKRTNAGARVVIYTIETFLNDLKRKVIRNDTFKNIFIDEYHLRSTRHNKFIGNMLKHGSRVVGMTATPYDANGEPFEIWDKAKSLVSEEWSDINRYIKEGYLSPLVYKVVGDIDIESLDMGKNDIKQSSINEAVKNSPIDVVQVTIDNKIGQTIIVCANIEHAEALGKDLKQRGKRVGVLHSKASDKQILEKFKKEQIEFILSVNMIATGQDIPIATTLVLARPIGSQSLWRQIIGRVLRLHEGKDYGLVLDCYNSIEINGSHPLQKPPTVEKGEGKKKAKCFKCESETPYVTISVEIEEEEEVKITKCTCCGQEKETRKILSFVTCDKCQCSEVVGFIYSSMGKVYTDCKNCNHNILMGEVTPKELIVTFQNREDAISQITLLAGVKIKEKSVLDRFLVAFSIFAIDAQLNDLSFITDIVGDFKNKYSQNSINKLIKRMEAKSNKPKEGMALTIARLAQLDALNYELASFIDDKIKGLKLDSKYYFLLNDELTDWQTRGQDLLDTKKIKSLINAWIKRNI